MSKIKLFIQVPCLNESKTLPSVIADIPDIINGVDETYIIIIDDGSTDNTIEVARELGVDYIVRNGRNLGLARSFSRGLEASLFLGADIIVNTDGDNQYKGADIAKLLEPILQKGADVVIGCRDITNHKEFTRLKKLLHKLGCIVVRQLSGIDLPDVASGFRAMNRGAAIQFSFMGDFSYTLEMLIQSSRLGLKVGWVPIETNPKIRKSRLFKSNFDFILQQSKILFKVYLFYYPIKFFAWLVGCAFILSLLLGLRILYFIYAPNTATVKFKTGTGILLLFTSLTAILFLATGLLSSILSGLRFLMIDLRNRVQNIELKQNIISLDFELITASEFFTWKKNKLKTEKEYKTKL